MSAKFLIFFFGIILLSNSALAVDDCQTWFKDSGIPPQSKDCILKCDILPKDMSTFTCASQCDKFCKSKTCETDSYWKNKIKDGRPSKWNLPSEVSIQWTLEEKKKLLELLSRLPDQLKSIPFIGIYRMKKSVSITNPGTTSMIGDTIVLYDRAFDNPFLSTSRVVVHELAHIVYLNYTKDVRDNYEFAMQWKSGPNGKIRPGSFINSQAKENPDEDFANNFDYFLFEPEKLKAEIPKAYNWMQKKFSDKFNLKEECQNDKSKK